MESSLLDLRNYVENILTETNSQLGSIASEVENSHDKILKVLWLMIICYALLNP